MSDFLRNAVSKGISLAIILIFLFLIGFLLTIATLISRVIQTDPASLVNLLIFLILLGVLTGISTARRPSVNAWWKAVLAGAVSGFVAGILVAIVAYIFGEYYANGTDVRTYLSAVSPEAILQFDLYRHSTDAAVSHLLLLLGSNIAGGIIGYLLELRDERRKKVKVKTSLWQSVVQSPLSFQLRSNPVARYALLGLILVALLVLPMKWGSYWNYIMGTVGIYILLGLGLNIIVGLSGQLVLGYVAFFGIGAYAFALLTAPTPHHLEWNFWVALVAGVLIAGLSGILIGLPIMRLRGDYLAIVTLGFGEIFRILLRSDLMTPFTAGPRGVRNIAGPILFGKSFATDVDFMYLIIVAVLLLVFITSRIQNTHVGRAWLSIREDEMVAQASGVDTYKYKLLALAIGAAFAGLGGGLFASRNQFTGPEDHVLMVSINVLCLVIVGGMGSIPGVIIGAFVLKGLPEILRDLENYRLLVFGALLVVMMILRPEGIWPARRPRLEKEVPPETVPPERQPTIEAEVKP